MTVIDVHTHMLSEPWLDLLRRHGAPRYDVRPGRNGKLSIRRVKPTH